MNEILKGIGLIAYGKVFHEALHWMKEKYGEIISFQVLFRRVIIISRMDYVEHILSRRQIYELSGLTSDNFSLLFPYGILSLKGAEWKRHARLMIPCFRRSKVVPYFQTIVDCFDDFIDEIFVESKGEIHENLVEECQIVLVRIVGCIAFNVDLSTISTNSDENIHQAFHQMIRCASRFALMSAIPLWLARILIKFNWKFQRALKIMKRYVMIIVDHARERINERKCLIDLLIESSINEKNCLTNDEIFDEVSISILAGFETTSTALSWFIYFMSKYPNIQQKIKEELRDNGLTSNSILTYEMIEKLIYVDCVTKEVLRFAPIAAGILREAIDDDILDGYPIRKGDFILIAIQNLHQHPKYWNIDPKLFYPERFLHEDKSPPRYAYLPFGGGHRACIGQDLAMLELKTAITRLMQRVTIADPGHGYNNSGGFTQHITCFPKHLTVRVTID